MKKTIVHSALDGKHSSRRVIAGVLFEPIGEPSYIRQLTYDIEPLDGEGSSELLARANLEILRELDAMEEDDGGDGVGWASTEFEHAFNEASKVTC